MRTLIGTWRAAAGSIRNTSCASPSATPTRRPTVNPFSDTASPIARATRTPSTTAAVRCSALPSEARTFTCTTTIAVSAASTGASTSVEATANAHATPAAKADLATVPISVDVGGVHATAVATRSHSRRTRPPEPCTVSPTTRDARSAAGVGSVVQADRTVLVVGDVLGRCVEQFVGEARQCPRRRQLLADARDIRIVGRTTGPPPAVVVPTAHIEND